MVDGTSNQGELLAQAQTLMEQRLFAEAVAILRSMIGDNPENYTALELLGKAQFKNRDFQNAALSFADAFKRCGDVDMLNWQGLALRKLGRRQEAEACFRQAMVLAPNDPNPKTNLASLIAEQAPQDALEMLVKYYREMPSINFLFPIVQLLFLKNDFLNAGLALAKIPENLQSHSLLTREQIFAAFRNGAVQAWERQYYREALILRRQAWAMQPVAWERTHPLQDCPSPLPSLRYSREHPSPRYDILSEQYGLMHANAAQSARKTSDFAGTRMNFLYAPLIKDYLQAHGATSLLDYGGGRGMQYKTVIQPNGTMFDGLGQYYGVAHAASFDAGWPVECPYPEGQTFDAVVSCDVLEHIDEADLPWVIDELFTFARKAIFVAIGSYPAIKTLPNGENAHCTIKPSSWWRPLFAAAALRHPGVHYRVLNITSSNFSELDGFEGIG